MTRTLGAGPARSGIGPDAGDRSKHSGWPTRPANVVAILALGVQGTVASANGAAQSALDELVHAERSFAAAADSGVSSAFLAVLDPDGVVFTPGPVNARQFHTDTPFPAAAVLRWHPRQAAIAQSGDLGYTTGPWVAGTGERQAFGTYVSIWRRNDEGRFRLLVDLGTSHPPLDDHSEDPGAVVRAPVAEGRRWPESEREARHASLAAAADRLHGALTAARSDVGPVLPDVRIHVDGQPPTVGRDAIGAIAERDPAGWVSRGQGVSLSGDLGYVFGTFETSGGAGNFLEIWFDSEGAWSLGLMVFQEVGAPDG